MSSAVGAIVVFMRPAIESYRAATPRHLEHWDLADPARLLRDLATTRPLHVGQTLLCQVLEPATQQRLTAQTVVWEGRGPVDEMLAQDQVEDAMRRLGHRDFDWDDDLRLRSAVVIVVVRDGRAVDRHTDRDVSRAIRYANNPFQALIGDLVVVTPYGWIALPDGVAGLEPRATHPAQ